MIDIKQEIYRFAKWCVLFTTTVSAVTTDSSLFTKYPVFVCTGLIKKIYSRSSSKYCASVRYNLLYIYINTQVYVVFIIVLQKQTYKL